MSRPNALVFLWTRRVHYALGLFLLCFIWLFAVSGLLLNHEWDFDEFWQNRIETKAESPIQVPPRMDDVAAAEHLMRQLGIRGELNKVERDAAGSLFKFDVSRPGESFKVEANLASHMAAVTRIEMNGWGVFRNLHTFTGSRYNDPERKRDWAVTTLWVVAMFASALGLIAMVITSLYLWWRLASKRTLGTAVLGAGMLSTGYFIWGLRLFF